MVAEREVVDIRCLHVQSHLPSWQQYFTEEQRLTDIAQAEMCLKDTSFPHMCYWQTLA